MRTSIQRTTKRSRSGKIAEFGPALFILMFIVLFPCLNLVWLACAYGIIALAANQCVAAAAVESTYDKALAGMNDAAVSFNNSAWKNFAGISPVGGYSTQGSDLYVDATSMPSHKVEEWGPNSSAPPPIDTTNNVWEFKSRVQYAVKPIFNLSSVPFIQNVPGLGKPATLTCVAHKLAEHPEGLAQDPNAQGFSFQPSGSLSFVASSPSPSGTGGGATFPTGVAWRNPKIYDQIATAGETIVAQEILTVDSSNPNWTPTNLTVLPGQKIWVDTHAVGQWTLWIGVEPMTDANGYDIYVNKPTSVCPPVNDGALLGILGAGSSPAQIQQPGAFFLGNQQLNYPLGGSGPLSLICNDEAGSYSSNLGKQVVRVIVVK